MTRRTRAIPAVPATHVTRTVRALSLLDSGCVVGCGYMNTQRLLPRSWHVHSFRPLRATIFSLLSGGGTFARQATLCAVPLPLIRVPPSVRCRLHSPERQHARQEDGHVVCVAVAGTDRDACDTSVPDRDVHYTSTHRVPSTAHGSRYGKCDGRCGSSAHALGWHLRLRRTQRVHHRHQLRWLRVFCQLPFRLRARGAKGLHDLRAVSRQASTLCQVETALPPTMSLVGQSRRERRSTSHFAFFKIHRIFGINFPTTDHSKLAGCKLVVVYRNSTKVPIAFLWRASGCSLAGLTSRD